MLSLLVKSTQSASVIISRSLFHTIAHTHCAETICGCCIIMSSLFIVQCRWRACQTEKLHISTFQQFVPRLRVDYHLKIEFYIKNV